MRLLFLSAASVAICSSTGCFSYSVRAEIRTTHQLETEGLRRVVVDTGNGRVKVSASPGASAIRCEATRFANARSEGAARSEVASIQIELGRGTIHPDEAFVRAVFPQRWWGSSLGASFELEIPVDVDLEVRTSNGSVSVTGTRGDVKLRTSNGSIDATDLSGGLDAKTSNGAIRLRGVDGGEMSAVSSNGSIRIDVPSDVSAELTLQTSNGSISKDLGDFQVTGLESSRSHLRARLNGGRGRIEARTSNGAIDFRASR